MSIPAGVVTVRVSALPSTVGAVVSSTATISPSQDLIWSATGQRLAAMCNTYPAPGWVLLPAVDQAGFITPDTRTGVTGWSYLITVDWIEEDGSSHSESGTIQVFRNETVEYLVGSSGVLVAAADYPVGGVALSGWVDTYAHLPTGLGVSDAGKTYMVQADQRMYVWSGTAWPASGQGFSAGGPAGPTGNTGATGPANTLTVGTVQVGTPISVTITGTAPSQTINFTLPEGHWWTGSGAPGTISGALSSDIYFDNSGTGNLYQLQSGTWVSQGSIKGPAGTTGLTGSTGQRGSDWFTGSGAPGTVSGAVNGDFYLDSASGTFYKYNGTSWSSQGSLLGPTGLTGSTGASSTWRSGAGVPSSGLGANGDMYLNTANGDVYGPKASGAWGAAVANITGPAAADATASSKGILQLAGDLGGTAASPTVPGLASKASTSTTMTAGTGLTGGGDLSASRTYAVSYGTAAGTAAQGNDSRIVGAAPAASPTLTGTITLNGTPAGTGVAAAATANTLALRDANANLTSVNMLTGYSTTTTAAGTTTLTAASNALQFFTGTTTQTVTLPVASTLVLGMSWTIINLSTGTVTVQSSGANTVIAIPGGSQSVVTCILTSGTTAASWSATAPFAPLASPALTGNPTAPTQTAGDSSTKVATTSFVATSFAPLASPALTGTPTAPTAATSTNTTQIATTAFVQAAAQITGGTVTMKASQTAAYTAAAGDFVPCSASGAAFTVTLPTAPSNGARVAVMKTDTSTNAVTIGAGGSDVINAAGTTSIKLVSQLSVASLEYNSVSAIWYNQEAGAPCKFTWLVQSGTRATGYGDMPEGIYFDQAATIFAVQFRAGTADASGSNTIALYSNTTNAATGTAITSGSTTLTATSAGAKTILTGPWSVAAGTFLQVNVTALGTTPGARLYADVIGTYI